MAEVLQVELSPVVDVVNVVNILHKQFENNSNICIKSAKIDLNFKNLFYLDFMLLQH